LDNKERRRDMKDKLEKLKKLADAMYYAAQYLTTDASKLHKAMDEYHQFIINEYHKEEHEYLEEEIKFCAFSTSRYTDKERKALCKGCEEECKFNKKEEPVSEDLEKEYDKYIENDGDEPLSKEYFLKLCQHFANWQKQQMMAKAVDGKVLANGMGNPILHLWNKGRHLIDKKVKVIIIKED
jgi:hypothetical protein